MCLYLEIKIKLSLAKRQYCCKELPGKVIPGSQKVNKLPDVLPV